MSADSVLPAVYNPNTREWIFTRQHGNGCILRPLGISRIHITAPTQSAFSLAKSTLHKERGRRWDRCLMQDAPEVAPGLEFLSELLEESHILTASAEVNDPIVGRLMDVGRAIVTDGDGQGEGVKTLAYATGMGGSEIGISRIVDEQYRIDGRGEQMGEDKTLAVPELEVSKTSAYKFMSQVRQICAAKSYSSERYNPLIAVRTADSSMILKHEYRPQHRPKIICIPVDRVTNERSGGVTHADITFSPFSNRHIGIVDERGAWVVREIDGKVKHVATGTELVGVPQGYGWGKIQWGVDENSLIVANRSRVALFDIRATPPGISFIRVNNNAERDWVLDVCPVPNAPNNTMLLTSSSLVLVDARMPGKRLVSVDHFRHSDDISLSMETFTIRDSTTILLYSRMNPIISAFQLRYTDSIPIWLDDPYLFPVEGNPKAMALSVLSPQVSLLDGCAQEGEDQFVTCIHLSTDMVLKSQIYTTGTESGVPISIGTAGTRAESQGTNLQSEEIGGSPSDTDMQGAYPRKEKQDMEQPLLTDMRELYKYAFMEAEDSLKTVENEGAAELFITAAEERLRAAREDRRKGVVTLYDLQRPTRLFSDLGGLSVALDQLLLETSEGKATKSLIPRCEGLPFRDDNGGDGGATDRQGEKSDIQEIYTRIFDGWVKPLPEHVAAKVRLRKERIARMIATETYLASMGVLLNPPSPPPPPLEIQIGEESQQDVPMSSQSPTLEQEADISSTNANTATTKSPSDLLTSLRKYTDVVNVSRNPPEGLTRVLEQWELGEAPEDFEWTEEGDVKKGKSRAGSRRSGARYKKRGGATDDRHGISMSQGGFGGSQPARFAVSVRGAMQPTQVGAVASSQSAVGTGSQETGTGVAMSQVERGKFGGRKPVKKKRKQGF